jgi:hypothetical protein
MLCYVSTYVSNWIYITAPLPLVDLMGVEYSLQHLLGGRGSAWQGMCKSLSAGTVRAVTSSSPISGITLCRRLHSSTRGNPGEGGCSSSEGVWGSVLPHAGVHITLVKHLSFLTTYRWLQHKTRLLLQMQKDMSRIDSLLLECGKKWRDAAKVIPIKLSLLASTLKGYEMEYTPVQFFYTVVLFGQWHPAAQSSFGSHWNEQGIQRLRSSITTAAKDIEKRLQMYVIPVLTNFILSCRELVGIEEAEHELVANQPSSSTLQQVKDKLASRKGELNNLINNAEWLMYKVDETLHECKFAGRNLLLFLKFLKQNMLLAAADEAREDAPPPPPQVSPAELLPLFDPRVPRAAEGVFGPKAHAECVTGTHLYAYFLEAPLPPDVVEYRKPFNGFYSNVRAEELPGIKGMDALKEIMAIAEENTDFDAESFAKVSLLSQFKGTNAVFQTVLQHGQYLPHMHFDPASSCDSQQSSDLDVNIIFNFQDSRYGTILADDIINVHKMAICTEDKKSIVPQEHNREGSVGNSDDEDSDDDESLVVGNMLIDSGHLIVFALTSVEFLVLWRTDSAEVEWFSALICLDLPPEVSAQAALSAVKLYSCAAAESRPARVALVGCLSGAREDSEEVMPSHLIFKVDLLATSFDYKNVTNMIIDSIGHTDSVVLIGNNIFQAFEESVRVSPKLREVHFSGSLVEIKTCASRGLLSLMLSDEADHQGVAHQMIILDMEEDEEDSDEDSDEDSEENDDEGDMSTSDDGNA